MSYVCDVGDTRKFKATFTDSAGTLTNPSTVTFKLKDPDGNVTTPSPTNSSTGVYEVTRQLTSSGRWWFRWETDATFGAAHEDYIDVNNSAFV